MKIGKTLQKLREIRGYTQEGVAHELEISQSAYSKIENNSASISLEKMMRLSKILKIPLEKILVFDIEKYVENSKTIEEPMVDSMKALKELYETRITHLKEEVLFLRDELRAKRNEK
jgi:transcriptional regulator with XRE-family HTH domain